MGWRINEDFIESNIEDSNDIVFETDVQYLGKLNDAHNDYHFYPRKRKLKRLKNLLLTCIIRTVMLQT